MDINVRSHVHAARAGNDGAESGHGIKSEFAVSTAGRDGMLLPGEVQEFQELTGWRKN